MNVRYLDFGETRRERLAQWWATRVVCPVLKHAWYPKMYYDVCRRCHTSRPRQ